MQASADLAGRLGLKLVTFHAGFLPHEEKDPAFASLQDRIRRIADLFQARGIALGMETGRRSRTRWRCSCASSTTGAWA